MMYGVYQCSRKTCIPASIIGARAGKLIALRNAVSILDHFSYILHMMHNALFGVDSQEMSSSSMGLFMLAIPPGNQV